MTKPLRAGVIGVGYLGRLHAQKYRKLAQADLIGVFDIDAERAGEVAESSACRAYRNVQDLLAAVDVVSIAVPTSEHLRIGILAVSAGIPVLMEKPLAADPTSAQELARATREAGVLMQVGHLERFNKVFHEVRALVRSPRFIECDRLSPFAGRGADTNVVYDVMIHDLDIIDFLVDAPVVGVEAVGVPILSPQTDIANARLRFANGCIANVTASRVSLKRERKLRVFEPDVYVSFDFDSGRVVLARRRQGADAEQVSSPMDLVEVQERNVGAGDALLDEIAAFLSCVRGGTRPLVGVDEALRAMQTADRVVRSIGG